MQQLSGIMGSDLPGKDCYEEKPPEEDQSDPGSSLLKKAVPSQSPQTAAFGLQRLGAIRN
jgi:hypothetical protein